MQTVLRLFPQSVFLAVGVLALCVLGCSKAEESKRSDTDPLRNTPIASDFTFATTRQVSVHLEVAQSLTDETGKAGIEVKLPDGRSVYRGPISSSSPLDTALSVPTKDGQLSVTLFTGSNRQTQAQVDIQSDGKASYTFR